MPFPHVLIAWLPQSRCYCVLLFVLNFQKYIEPMRLNIVGDVASCAVTYKGRYFRSFVGCIHKYLLLKLFRVLRYSVALRVPRYTVFNANISIQSHFSPTNFQTNPALWNGQHMCYSSKGMDIAPATSWFKRAHYVKVSTIHN